MDRIEYYSDKDIKGWFKAFEDAPDYVNYLKGIPFSYREVRNEMYRRENIRAAEEELKAFFNDD